MATVRIQVRRDSAADWTSEDPTMTEGEIGYETDTNKFKIGDGSTVWSSLNYFVDETAIPAITTYTTGWVENALGGVGVGDWTGVELAITHNLATNLSDLIVKFFISTDGTEANAFEIPVQGLDLGAGSNGVGFAYFQDSTSVCHIQTGNQGIYYIDDAGNDTLIAAQNWYYKVKVYYIQAPL